MEKIIWNKVQLDFLARHDHVLCPHFYGTLPTTNYLIIHIEVDVWGTW